MEGSPSSSQTMESLNFKVEFLERTLIKFQAEVDFKMKLVEQLLSNRTEQVSVQKKFLEQEETLYQYLMTGWNTAREGQQRRNNSTSEKNVDRLKKTFESRSQNLSIELLNRLQPEIDNPSQKVVDLTRDNAITATSSDVLSSSSASSSFVNSFTSHVTRTSMLQSDPLEGSSSSPWKNPNSNTQKSIEPSASFSHGSMDENSSDPRYLPTVIEVSPSPFALKLCPEEIEESNCSIKSEQFIVGMTDTTDTSDYILQDSQSEKFNEHGSALNIPPLELGHSSSIVEFKCRFCNKVLQSRTALKYHLTIHQGGMRFPCNQCGKIFPRKASLTRHKLRHEAYMGLNCHNCPGVQFSGKDVLVEHMETQHGIKKPWMCSYCRTCFVQRTALQEHISSNHPGVNATASSLEKRVQCSMCSKNYGTRNDLLVHMRSHTGERPFNCSLCRKSFADRRNLKKHSEICTGPIP